MSNSKVIGRYMWLLNALRSCGRLTRQQLEDAWLKSHLYEGRPLRRRTFYADRLAIKELFGVDIVYDSRTLEYHLETPSAEMSNSLINWIVQQSSVNQTLSSALELADRIVVEEVPSARENLAPILDAMKQQRVLSFTYHPFTRTLPSRDVKVEPYMVKLFRQRWYLTGRNRAERRLKTYALDRIRDLQELTETFAIDAQFNAADYCSGSFGIVVDRSEVRRVELRTDTVQARYLRALPLHSSQQEMVGNGYSVFTYHLRLTDDFVAELMQLGPGVTVLNPKELRDRLCDRLRSTLALYEPSTTTSENE